MDPQTFVQTRCDKARQHLTEAARELMEASFAATDSGGGEVSKLCQSLAQQAQSLGATCIMLPRVRDL